MSKVNWHVANCTVTESAYDDPILELELTGYCDHKYLRSITDRNAWFAEIEKKLNADDRYDIHIDPYVFQKQMYKIRKDTEMTKQIVNSVFGAKRLDIKKVIFNDPATIVMWADGTKTVVKCSENDIFDPEKGLAMAITKKALGNQGNYHKVIKKWTKDYQYPEVDCLYPSIPEEFKSFGKRILSDFLKGIENEAERDV